MADHGAEDDAEWHVLKPTYLVRVAAHGLDDLQEAEGRPVTTRGSRGIDELVSLSPPDTFAPSRSWNDSAP
jgi:hypothetical protein